MLEPRRPGLRLATRLDANYGKAVADLCISTTLFNIQFYVQIIDQGSDLYYM